MKKNNYNYIIVAGCSRFGAHIASMLSAQGKDVVALDKYSSSFRKLSPDYSGFSIVADATDIDELTRAGIEKADVVVAATDDDNVNIMIAQIASRIFNVPKVVSRLYDTEKEIVYQDFNIQIIYPSRLSITEFEKLILIDNMEELK
ncbi:MAG: potassium transporter TrkA [Clostridia bacterium BRH_c25]|nr:MAG: potassium transporter TrkA [Clostridia bacterium BRH_c25]